MALLIELIIVIAFYVISSILVGLFSYKQGIKVIFNDNTKQEEREILIKNWKRKYIIIYSIFETVELVTLIIIFFYALKDYKILCMSRIIVLAFVEIFIGVIKGMAYGYIKELKKSKQYIVYDLINRIVVCGIACAFMLIINVLNYNFKQVKEITKENITATYEVISIFEENKNRLFSKSDKNNYKVYYINPENLEEVLIKKIPIDKVKLMISSNDEKNKIIEEKTIVACVDTNMKEPEKHSWTEESVQYQMYLSIDMYNNLCVQNK